MMSDPGNRPSAEGLYDAIEAGAFPEWELDIQITSDDEHPELDFDPLDYAGV